VSYLIPRPRKAKLYRAVLKMRGVLAGDYMAQRLVEALDPDDAVGKAIEVETARQRGAAEAGGMGHSILGVALVRRVAA